MNNLVAVRSARVDATASHKLTKADTTYRFVPAGRGDRVWVERIVSGKTLAAYGPFGAARARLWYGWLMRRGFKPQE